MQKKRAKTPARILAVIAIVGAAVALVAVVAGGSGGNSASKTEYGKEHKQHKPRTKASFYVIESGDTLIAIAHKIGIPIRELEELNPEIDPQLLNAGEKLKLK